MNMAGERNTAIFGPRLVRTCATETCLSNARKPLSRSMTFDRSSSRAKSASASPSRQLCPHTTWRAGCFINALKHRRAHGGGRKKKFGHHPPEVVGIGESISELVLNLYLAMWEKRYGGGLGGGGGQGSLLGKVAIFFSTHQNGMGTVPPPFP